jgi:hypothetical protein
MKLQSNPAALRHSSELPTPNHRRLQDATPPARICPKKTPPRNHEHHRFSPFPNPAKKQEGAGRAKSKLAIPGTADQHPAANASDPAWQGAARPSPPDPGMSQRTAPAAASCSPTRPVSSPPPPVVPSSRRGIPSLLAPSTPDFRCGLAKAV